MKIDVNDVSSFTLADTTGFAIAMNLVLPYPPHQQNSGGRLWELNEVFACQALCYRDKSGIDPERYNG